MARTARVKLTGTSVADYHLISRTNDKRFLFEKGAIKSELVDALKRAAAFCGVRIRAYTVMSNHFHVVVRVTRTDEPIPEEELICRVKALKGEKAARELSERWKEFHAAGYYATLEDEQKRLCAQMNDISAFIKVFKELFNRWYKKEHPYTGSIWEGRFKSTLIEGGQYLATCIKYVIYNPIRAGMVRQVKEYLWSWSEKEEKSEVSLGTVPEEWCMKRRVQMGEGRVYGSEGYVRKMSFAVGWCFKAKGVGAHGIMNLPEEAGMAVMGWKLAGAQSA